MAIGFDRALNVHAQALEIRARRAEILAANLANTDTPNYQARDIDFKAALASWQDHPALQATHADHLQGSAGRANGLLYRQPAQMAIDGNTVEEEHEKAQFADNAFRYQASLRLLGNRVQGLLSAIRGE
jgi:flagellar basal-body rod protein FlgB